MSLLVNQSVFMQMNQQRIKDTTAWLNAKRNERLMSLPDMTQVFSQPYVPEPIPRRPLPPVNVPHKMTYDEAYEEASIAAAEIVGSNSHEYEALSERLLDELCIKHDIE